MTSPVFIDTNIPIYAAGRPHPLKAPCREVVKLVAAHPQAFVTDAEVMQELLHRYLALHNWAVGSAVFARFAVVMRDRIEPMYPEDVERVAALVDTQPGLSARDLVHLAVMMRIGAVRIVTADHGFDGIAQAQRLDPADVSMWGATLAT